MVRDRNNNQTGHSGRSLYYLAEPYSVVGDEKLLSMEKPDLGRSLYYLAEPYYTVVDER